jgi:hypothetical protein
VQNPEARRRTAIAAAIAIAVIVVLAIAIRAGGDSDSSDNPTATGQSDAAQSSGGDQQSTSGDQSEPGGIELGSLAVSAYRCPALSSPDETCIDAGPVDLTAFSLKTPDGQTLTVDNATRTSDGAYTWLNIQIGSYELNREDVQGPAGTVPRNVAGSAEPVADGWTVDNNDPNQPAVLRIMFAPGEGSPAAG